MQDDDLFAQRPPDNEQWFDQNGQVGEVLDQLLDPRLELRLADHSDLEAKVTQRTAQVVLDGDSLRLQQLAMGQQHSQLLTAQGLHMHRTVKPDPHHLCDAAGIVAVRLVDLRFEHRLHVPRLNTDHRQARFGERAVKPLRQRSSFQSNSLEVVGGVVQYRQQRLRFAGYLHFANNLARVIHNANAGLLDRYVQSSKMVHAALLLLMLEAAKARPRFTITLTPTPQNLHLSTARRPLTPPSARQ